MHDRHLRGTAITYFLVLISVLTTSLLTTMALTAGGGVQVSSMTLKRDQAFYVAEAGLQRAIWYYKQNSSWRATTASPLTGSIVCGSNTYAYSVTCLDSGTGTVALVSKVQTPASPAASQVSATYTGGGTAPGLAVGNNLADSGTLTVTGDVQAKGNITRSGTMNLLNITGNPNSNLEALGYFLSSGTFTVPGNLLIEGANGSNSISSSGSVTVAGNAEGTNNITHSGTWKVTGTTTPLDNPNLSINTPTVNTASLIAEAQSDGTVYSSLPTTHTIDFTKGPNHVVYITGNLSLAGTTTVIGTGTLIVQGTLTASGFIGSATTPAPMNIVTTSDASMSGAIYLNGALCVGGSLTKSGQTTVNGVVIVQSNLNGTGNVTINYTTPPSFIQYAGSGGSGSSSQLVNFTGPIF